MHPTIRLGAAICALVLSASSGLAGQPVIAGYSDYADLTRRVQALQSIEDVSVRSLTRTAAAREVWLITIGKDDLATRPAICIVGNTVASDLVGSQIALGIAESIAKSISDEKTKALLDHVTLYIIPRPNPDGSERFFTPPYFDIDGNSAKTDDDRDFTVGEDPPEDLNNDGFITLMRVADPLGEQILHPDDPRILIPADPKKGENGTFRVYPEGIDNDHDEKWNEDPSAGVSFNRNFPAKYPYFGEHAGPNAVSEPETRAVADFLFDHPNVALVLCFSPEDNLFHPWKPAADAANQKIKLSIQPDDVPFMDDIAKQYQKIHGGKDCPDSPRGAGSFSDWAYLQYGRWSFAARAWWIPPADKPQAEKEQDDDSKKEEPSDAEKTRSTKKDDRGKRFLRALEWFSENNIDAFSDWTKIDHPDFPGKVVEVGGIRPFFLQNPPAEEIPSLTDKHVRFLHVLKEQLPKLAIHDVRVEPAGNSVYRVTLHLANEGKLPTMSKMGHITRIPIPINWQLDLPDTIKILSGNRRGQMDPLAGSGGNAKLEWLLLASGDNPKIDFIATSPAVGEVKTDIQLVGR